MWLKNSFHWSLDFDILDNSKYLPLSRFLKYLLKLPFRKLDNLEKKIGWEIARVIKIDDTKAIIETKNNKKGELNSLSIDWIKNSKNKKNFNVGDIIYVRQDKTKV